MVLLVYYHAGIMQPFWINMCIDSGKIRLNTLLKACRQSYLNLAPRDGFEPTALGLEVLCSIQLSYRGINGAGGESRTPVTNLEGWDNGRYTTPASNRGDYSTFWVVIISRARWIF